MEKYVYSIAFAVLLNRAKKTCHTLAESRSLALGSFTKNQGQPNGFMSVCIRILPVRKAADHIEISLH
jgi:hypothetical protein